MRPRDDNAFALNRWPLITRNNHSVQFEEMSQERMTNTIYKISKCREDLLRKYNLIYKDTGFFSMKKIVFGKPLNSSKLNSDLLWKTYIYFFINFSMF